MFVFYCIGLYRLASCMGVRRPDKEYKVFQFPRTAIPRIDGDFSDWEIVPDSYSVGLSELYDTTAGGELDSIRASST